MTSLVRAGYGDKVSLGCYATGAPPIKYSWTKDNRAIINSETIKVLEDAVVVHPNTTADYGTFVCSVSNGRETASYVIKLEPVDIYGGGDPNSSASQQGQSYFELSNDIIFLSLIQTGSLLSLFVCFFLLLLLLLLSPAP